MDDEAAAGFAKMEANGLAPVADCAGFETFRFACSLSPSSSSSDITRRFFFACPECTFTGDSVSGPGLDSKTSASAHHSFRVRMIDTLGFVYLTILMTASLDRRVSLAAQRVEGVEEIFGKRGGEGGDHLKPKDAPPASLFVDRPPVPFPTSLHSSFTPKYSEHPLSHNTSSLTPTCKTIAAS